MMDLDCHGHVHFEFEEIAFLKLGPGFDVTFRGKNSSTIKSLQECGSEGWKIPRHVVSYFRTSAVDRCQSEGALNEVFVSVSFISVVFRVLNTL